MREREVNPIEGKPEEPHRTDEDVIWSSQSSHWHCTAQHIQINEVGEEAEHLQQAYDDGQLDSGPVQVTVRNRQGRPIRVLSEWDGWQLHLDVATTEEPTLSPRDAMAATWRYLLERYGGWILLACLLALITLTSVVTGVLFSVIV